MADLMLYLYEIRGVMTELDPNLAIVVATVALPASIIGILKAFASGR